MQLAAESIIEAGRELIEQKKALGHGNFLPWIEAEFGMSDQTARNMMRVSDMFGGKFKTVLDLPPTALYALAAPSTPETVRAEVLERAAGGEKVTAKEIETLKRKLARAIRRAGGLLKQIEPAKNHHDASTRADAHPSRKDAATNAGMSPHQAKQAIRVANVPQDVFDTVIEDDKPATITELAEMGKMPHRPRRGGNAAGEARDGSQAVALDGVTGEIEIPLRPSD